ncbi:hypothetical protein O9G_002254 [Rozella allomycis CSF55]|uniref:Seipin n=1 Tax=Rozella allomycis (strain CSF55) TaxID=988480 RepID=A0A075B1F7_ROZAC|nr:hypothetical protein O9G_002254 [Rozella allomycis CSF55]|eukprot:EPZ36188.1 hypothetical protein O9G_002254 [Rozella allomycis CSF55]
MIKVDLLNAKDELIASCSKPALLRYESLLVKTIKTAFFGMLYIFNFKKEEETLIVTSFNGYKDTISSSATKVNITILDPNIQIYEAFIRFDALFTGLRYTENCQFIRFYMYFWKYTTATFFVLILFSIEAFLAFCVVYCVYSLTMEINCKTESVSDIENESEDNLLTNGHTKVLDKINGDAIVPEINATTSSSESEGPPSDQFRSFYLASPNSELGDVNERTRH